MFTISQIKEAHSRVKSGSDFPIYIQDLIALGVKGYEIFVNDGHEEYIGADDYCVTASAQYDFIVVAPLAVKEQFIEFLVRHQDGQTNYVTFCKHAAQCGIAKWNVNLINKKCTYFDISGDIVLVEGIPS